MINEETLKIMNEAIKPIKTIIEKAQANQVKALAAIQPDPLDTSASDEVKKIRELQAVIMRTKIEVYNDVLEIINALIPNA